MFTQADLNGKTKLTNLTKFVGSILTIIGFVAGGVLYFETTYMHKAEAKEMRVELEAQSVTTFQQVQRNNDIRYLDDLDCRKILMEKELERNPSDTLLRDKLRRVKDLIKKLEDKLFQ